MVHRCSLKSTIYRRAHRRFLRPTMPTQSPSSAYFSVANAAVYDEQVVTSHVDGLLIKPEQS